MALKREQVVQTAEKYVARGKIEPAIREYRKLLAENPNDINTLNRVGDLYARIQRFDEAVDFFTQIAERYSVEGFFVKAIAIYKKIIKLNPTLLDVYEKLAGLYAKQGLTNEARTQYLVLADYYQKHDNAASAIGIYNELVDLEPENPSHHVKLAEIYRQQKLFEKALGEYRTIAELMIDVGHLQEASQVYERALDLEAAGAAFLSDAVSRLRRAGGEAVAARLLAIAIERNPALERTARQLVAESPEPAATAPAPVTPPAASAAPAPPPPRSAARETFEVSPHATPFALDVDLDLDEDVYEVAADDEVQILDEAEPEVAPRLAPPPTPTPTLSARSAPPPAAESEEIDLDLDDVFVLEIEDDDDAPASLVKPPPDLIDEGPGRRPIWSQGASPSAPPATPRAAEASVPSPAPTPSISPTPSLSPTREAPPAAWRDFGEIDLSDLPPLEPLIDPFADLPEVAFDDFDEPVLRPSTPVAFDPDVLERTAAEINTPPPERDEDLVTEAEVLARYGLEEKALERLRDALRLNPRHLGAYSLLIQIHSDHHRTARVVETANQMARIAHEIGSPEVWAKVKSRLISSGYRVDDDRIVSAPAPRGTRDQGVDQLLRGLLDEKPKRAPKSGAPSALPAAEAPTASKPKPAPPVAVPPPAAAAPKAPTPPVAEAAPAAPVAATPTPPAPAAPPSFSTAAPPTMFDPRGIADSLLDEDDDFVVPGMRAEAPPLPAPPLQAAPPVQPAVPAPASLDDTGMSWLDEAEKQRPATAPKGGGLFAEDDFFDLAGELEQELEREVPFSAGELLVQPTEQTLEEIVEGFKKGVAENLSPTDFDTHYNLGIAYREMGLVDEAIGEFQLAAKDGAYLVSCCSMLGLCFLEKGLPELAIKWYRRGLEAPGVSEEDGLGLLYDLGNAHTAAGDAEGAYKSFVDLYGINSNYRDVVAKLEELGHSR